MTGSSAQPAGSAAAIDPATAAIAGFTPDVAGSYAVTLAVSDGEAVDTDEVIITALLPNVPPNADAGPNQSVPLGDVVVLDATASNDPDNGPAGLTFGWRFVSVPAGSGLVDGSVADAALAVAGFLPTSMASTCSPSTSPMARTRTATRSR